MQISHIDHIVLTVSDLKQTIAFYCNVLGMELEMFGEGRHALTFGNQKINLHEKGAEFKPNAAQANCGTVDICLISETPLPQVMQELQAKHITLESGIVPRTGALGAIVSIYLRDPDGNLIEISNY